MLLKSSCGNNLQKNRSHDVFKKQISWWQMGPRWCRLSTEFTQYQYWVVMLCYSLVLPLHCLSDVSHALINMMPESDMVYWPSLLWQTYQITHNAYQTDKTADVFQHQVAQVLRQCYIFVIDYLDSNLVCAATTVVVGPRKPTLHEGELAPWLISSHENRIVSWFCTKTKLLSTWLDIDCSRGKDV
jgi:hypothetical protein